MTTNIYSHKDKNIRKTWFFMAVFFILIILVGFVFAQIYGNPTILYIFVAVSIFLNVFSYWYSDKIVLKLPSARPATP